MTTIRIRYGKHKSEIKPAGFSKMESECSRSESFGKHACLEFGIDQDEFYIGMFHSPANDGIDQSYVIDHWASVKEKMLAAYDSIVGYDLHWVFWSNREGREIASYAIDRGNPKAFIEFYQAYYLQEVVSYCRCYIDRDDEQITTFNNIVSLVEDYFTALLSLYNAMTFRIAKSERSKLIE